MIFSNSLILEQKLVQELKKAIFQLREIGDEPIWSSYDSGNTLADFIEGTLKGIEQKTISKKDKNELWGIFAPTSDWDDLHGDPDIGNSVFELIQQLEFIK